jgi:hypothetical protein
MSYLECLIYCGSEKRENKQNHTTFIFHSSCAQSAPPLTLSEDRPNFILARCRVHHRNPPKSTDFHVITCARRGIVLYQNDALGVKKESRIPAYRIAAVSCNNM